MKKTITLFAFMLGTIFTISSQTLQFSSVKLIRSTEETVPIGKVWKVEGVGASRVTMMQEAKSTYTFAPDDQTIIVGGSTISVIQSFGSGAGSSYEATTNLKYPSISYAASATKLPFWLPEGTTLQTGTNVAFISVIEFTVVP